MKEGTTELGASISVDGKCNITQLVGGDVSLGVAGSLGILFEIYRENHKATGDLMRIFQFYNEVVKPQQKLWCGITGLC